MRCCAGYVLHILHNKRELDHAHYTAATLQHELIIQIVLVQIILVQIRTIICPKIRR